MPARHRPAPFAPRRASALTDSIGLVLLAIVAPLVGAMALLAVAALALITGCASPTDGPPGASSESRIAAARCPHASATPRVVGGVPDDDCDATPGVLFVQSLFGSCSGVLVSPHVVLTARHCVAPTEKTKTGGVNCGAIASEHARVSAAVAPELVTIATDTAADARRFAVKELRTPVDEVLCDADPAIIVLADAATGITPVAMRLHSRAESTERLRVVRFGKRDDGRSGERYRNDDIVVRRVGPDAAEPRLGAHELETARGFCQGDSGGPAIDQETNAVVGIVSRNQSCTADRGYVFTELAGVRTDVESAFVSAGESPELEFSRSSTAAQRARSAAFARDLAASTHTAPRAGLARTQAGPRSARRRSRGTCVSSRRSAPSRTPSTTPPQETRAARRRRRARRTPALGPSSLSLPSRSPSRRSLTLPAHAPEICVTFVAIRHACRR